MNWETIGVLLPVAVGVAISPAPIVEFILVIFSSRRVANSLAFVTTLILSTALAVALGAAGQQAASGAAKETSTGAAIVLIVFAVLLLSLAWRNWVARGDTSEPKVFSTISGMGPGAAAFLAIGAVFVNPKNLVLLLAAGQTIGASDGNGIVVGIVFVAVATLPYVATAAYALLGGDAASKRLDLARSWLIAHNRLIMAFVLGLLGLVLLAKGVGAL